MQIFNSWSGVLPPAEFERWCVHPSRGMVARLRAEAPQIPIIAFPRGAATQLAKIAEIEGLAAIGLDTAVEPQVAAATLPARLALQGNLDPLALIAGGRRSTKASSACLPDSTAAPMCSISATAFCRKRRSPTSSDWSPGWGGSPSSCRDPIFEARE